MPKESNACPESFAKNGITNEELIMTGDISSMIDVKLLERRNKTEKFIFENLAFKLRGK